MRDVTGVTAHRSCPTCSERPASSSLACCTHGRSAPPPLPGKLRDDSIGPESKPAMSASQPASVEDHMRGGAVAVPRHRPPLLRSQTAAQATAKSRSRVGGADTAATALRRCSALASPARSRMRLGSHWHTLLKRRICGRAIDGTHQSGTEKTGPQK